MTENPTTVEWLRSKCPKRIRGRFRPRQRTKLDYCFKDVEVRDGCFKAVYLDPWGREEAMTVGELEFQLTSMIGRLRKVEGAE